MSTGAPSARPAITSSPENSSRQGVRFRKDDNAFLWTDDPRALQAAADRLSAEIIRKRLDYWTLVLGPKFSKKDRAAIATRLLAESGRVLP